MKAKTVGNRETDGDGCKTSGHGAPRRITIRHCQFSEYRGALTFPPLKRCWQTTYASGGGFRKVHSYKDMQTLPDPQERCVRARYRVAADSTSTDRSIHTVARVAPSFRVIHGAHGETREVNSSLEGRAEKPGRIPPPPPRRTMSVCQTWQGASYARERVCAKASPSLEKSPSIRRAGSTNLLATALLLLVSMIDRIGRSCGP